MLINESAKAAETIERLLTDSAHKDESFCKLYEQRMEESKEKEDLIEGLKSTLADNVEEILYLRCEVKEILQNCI